MFLLKENIIGCTCIRLWIKHQYSSNWKTYYEKDLLKQKILWWSASIFHSMPWVYVPQNKMRVQSPFLVYELQTPWVSFRSYIFIIKMFCNFFPHFEFYHKSYLNSENMKLLKLTPLCFLKQNNCTSST